MANTLFKPTNEISFLSPGMAAIVCALKLGATTELGTVGVHASKRGYRITFRGKTLASGKTGHELQDSFDGAVKEAKAGKGNRA